jgi:hypothetical protein
MRLYLYVHLSRQMIINTRAGMLKLVLQSLNSNII